MSKQVTTESPKLFIGLDIHKKSWKFHFTTDLFVGKGKSFPPKSEVIRNYVDKNYPDYEVSIAYEVGCCGYVPARDFISFGWDTYVVNSADIPRPAKNKFVKSDKVDAKNIARELRSGSLRKIKIPDKTREGLRSLTRQRSALVRDFRRIKSRIKLALLYYHIDIPEGTDTSKWSLKFIGWLRELETGQENVQLTLQLMLTQYDFLDLQLKSISTAMRAYCKRHQNVDYELLRSIPGIAGLTAAYILSELGDLREFSSFKRLASYVGFVPGMQQSGETMICTGATPRANRHVRNIIVEASWIAIRIDPVMQNYYRSHAGKNSKAVIFKVGRKLLSKMLAVIKSGIPYQIGVVE